MNFRFRKIFITVFLSALLLSSCGKYTTRIEVNVDFFIDKFNGLFGNIDIETTSTSSDIVDETKKVVQSYGETLVSLGDGVASKSKYPVPNIGEDIHGFKVLNKYSFDERDAILVGFIHEKTGATAFLISNDDIDKTAVIGFNTLTNDDKGIPHVFEHATLGGSENYSSPNLFFEMRNKTYSTYLNAITMQCATIYPMGSLSDDQLFSYFKVYMDGVFNPDLLKDEKNFEKEAYRCILHSKDDNLDVSGVVYSEMAAHEGDIEEAAYYNTAKTLFKNSYVSSITGGKTSDILKLKVEDLRDFHNVYYHPSNMLITLYGDIDYQRYLEFADKEYLSHFEKKYIDKSDKLYEKNNGFIEKSFEFPVASNSSIDGGAVAYYSVSCDGLTPYETGVFSAILEELYSSDGPLANEVNYKIPYATYNVYSELDLPKPYFSIVVQNINESDKEVVLDVIESAIKKIVDGGVREETITSLENANEMEYELSRDSHGFAENAAEFYHVSFMNNGEDLLSYLKYKNGEKDIRIRNSDGTIRRLINTYLKDNDESVFTMTVPSPGKMEDQVNENKEFLRMIKENLSSDDVVKLIEKTTGYDDWVKASNEYSIIDRVRVASVSGLDEYKAKCYAYEENFEGIRFVRSDIDGIKYSYVNILLDASSIKADDLLKFRFLSDLLMYLPTENYDDFEIDAEFGKNAYSYDTSVYVNKYFNGGYKPYLSLQFMALDKNIDRIFELLNEVIYKTRFDDNNKLLNLASQNYTAIKTSINSNPSSYAESVLFSKIYGDGLYELHVTGIDYINFLNDVLKMDESEITDLMQECKGLLEKLTNKNGLTCEIISNFKTLPKIKSGIIDLTRNFTDEKRESIDYDQYLDKYDGNIAIPCNTYVQYNYIGVPFSGNDLKFTAKYSILNNIVNDKVMFPELRVKKSCYGAYANANLRSIYFATYRDPNLKVTFDVFDKVPKLYDDIKLTKQELEDYKLSAYSDYSYPLTDFSASSIAINEIMNECNDKRPERYLRYMREIKSTTLDDINSLKDVYKKLTQNGEIVVAGSEDKIYESSNMFDKVLSGLIK